MTSQPPARRLQVPGADLHYEVRGSGPLLLVVGQPMTGEFFAPLADLLAVDHTVVTYDPRGLGRSTVDDPERDVTPEDQADDLARLVRATGGAPADVFGSSGGAISALALAAAHPEVVRTVVAHEPPLGSLLPDAEHVAAGVAGVREAYRTGGSGAGWGAFVSLVMHQGPLGPEGPAAASWPPHGVDGDASEDAPAPPEPSEKDLADDALFFLHEIVPLAGWEPPVEVLGALGDRVVLGVGDASGAEMARRATDALAQRLGTEVAVFPGDHGGFTVDPAAFAGRLRAVLSRSVAPAHG